MKLFNKILIANRGEIARRIIRTAKAMNISPVAIYSDQDADALYVKEADEAIHLPGDELSETYLHIESIIAAAKKSGADALHPGYGFLAENADFAEACKMNGITFIGPEAQAIRQMGHKTAARLFAEKAGLPLSKGITGDSATLLEKAKEIPFPVLVKAAAGGGGKGMRIVHDPKDLPEILEATKREALSYFGNGEVYIEQYIINPRHIEVQVIGDKNGHYIHLFERECSLQRRYQKIIEESPSPSLTPEVREKMCGDAVQLIAQMKYSNAGTIEFLVDEQLNYYFLEMNTRIQVEHPVTEMVTGIDVVRQQILAAAGFDLEIKQEDISQNGHAIECRIYAEEPEEEFRPSPGKMSLYHEPNGNDLRIDTAYNAAGEVSAAFDPMIAKMVVHGKSRTEALEKSVHFLHDYAIHGIKHNIPYLIYLLHDEAFRKNNIHTRFCDIHLNEYIAYQKQQAISIEAIAAFLLLSMDQNKDSKSPGENSVWQQIGYWRQNMFPSIELNQKNIEIEIVNNTSNRLSLRYQNENYEITRKKQVQNILEFDLNGVDTRVYISWINPAQAEISFKGQKYTAHRKDILIEAEFSDDAALTNSDPGNITSPMPGKVIDVFISKNQEIKEGEPLLIVEAMKMENTIRSAMDGIVEEVNIEKGQAVGTSEIMVKIKAL